MKANDPQALRAIFRHMLVVVAASTGACGATVVAVPPAPAYDSGTPDDAVLVSDVVTADAMITPDAVTADAVLVRDAAPDVVVPTDRNACDPTRTIANPGSRCESETVSFPCGLPPELQLDGGGMVTDAAVCDRWCTIRSEFGIAIYCYVQAGSAAPNSLQCQIPCPGGRRPEGWRDRAGDGPEGVGAWFSRLASLEAASVFAFERMAVELAMHGAPAELVLLAREAIDDERRHTALTADLACAWGCAPQLPASAPMAPRSLDAVARDNAVEGCVRETYGALVATWQAAHARDERVAAALRVIADDETRHASLSWSTHAWLRDQLAEGARAELDAAMLTALGGLRAEVDVDVPDDLVHAAGMPTRAQQRALVDALARHIRS